MVKIGSVTTETRLSLKCSAWKGFMNFVSKNISIKVLSPKKILGLKKCWVWKKILAWKKSSGQKKIWVKQNFGSKKILSPKEFWVKKTILVREKFRVQKFCVNTSYVSQLDFQYVIADFGGDFLVLLVTCVIQTPNPVNSVKSPRVVYVSNFSLLVHPLMLDFGEGFFLLLLWQG